MKHTPGPWSASFASSVVGSLITAGSTNVAAAMPQVDKAECEANARLIESAPELLEACREVIALGGWAAVHSVACVSTGDLPFPCDCGGEALTQKIRELIKKVEDA